MAPLGSESTVHPPQLQPWAPPGRLIACAISVSAARIVHVIFTCLFTALVVLTTPAIKAVKVTPGAGEGVIKVKPYSGEQGDRGSRQNIKPVETTIPATPSVATRSAIAVCQGFSRSTKSRVDAAAGTTRGERLAGASQSVSRHHKQHGTAGQRTLVQLSLIFDSSQPSCASSTARSPRRPARGYKHAALTLSGGGGIDSALS